MKRKKTAIIGMLLICFVLGFNQLQAQNVSMHKYEIEVSASSFKLLQDGKFFGNYLLNADVGLFYSINDIFSIGAYYGMGTYKRMEFYWVEENHYRTSGFGGKSYAYLYGLSGKIHLIPLLSNKNTKIDLYIKSKLGLIKFNSLKDQNITPVYGSYFDATFNGGCTFYLSNYFGISAEAGYRYFEYHKGFNARFGFLFSF